MGLFSKVRKALYSTAKVLGDLDAIKEDKVAKRLKNRVKGKVAVKFLKKI